jgi:hypothetical protein
MVGVLAGLGRNGGSEAEEQGGAEDGSEHGEISCVAAICPADFGM